MPTASGSWFFRTITAHVHVFGQGGEAKIVLEGSGRVDWVVGISRADLRRVMLEVRREREQLIAAWRRIHGP